MKALSRWTWLPLALLAFSLPFELDRPLLTLGPLAITNLEILLGLVLLSAAWVYWRDRPVLPYKWPDYLLLGLTLLFMLLAAALAPADRLNALKAALRSGAGLALLLAVPVLLRPAARRRVLLALVAGAALAALLGIAEVLNGAGLGLLDPFRPGPFRVGPYLRLTGPFDYTNQAAMYLEAVLPLIWLGVWLRLDGRRLDGRRLDGRRLDGRRRWGALALCVLCLQAALLTLSRAAVGTMVVGNLLIAGLLFWQQRRHDGPKQLPFGSVQGRSNLPYMPYVALAALALGLFLVNQLLNPVFRLRLEADEENWYRAALSAPAQVLAGGDMGLPVTITVANQGELIWDSDDNPPIRLGARWLDPATGEIVGESRWHLGEVVRPGESLTLIASLQAPEGAESYLLLWDMVQEGVTWFSSKTGQAVQSEAIVTNDAAALPPATDSGPALAQAVDIRSEGSGATYGAPQPPRLTLWRVALTMIGERPLFGWGLDNFRLQYGPRLGFSIWDETVHTNNWYLEMLVSLGLLGSAPFLLWLGWLLLGMIQRLGQSGRARQTALAAGVLTFFLHGLFDYFLLFNATALLFWLLVGLWYAEPKMEMIGSNNRDANRL